LKRSVLHIAFLVAGLLFSTLSAFGQQVDVFASSDSVSVGDRFRLTVVIGHDGSRNALFPHDMLPDTLKMANSPFSLGDFEILSVLNQGGRPYSTGGRIDSVVYEATTFALDSARVAGIPVGLSTEVDTLFGAGPALAVRVGSLVPEGTTELKDIMPLAEFPQSWWPWILGALALLAVGLAIWWWRRKQASPDADSGGAVKETPPYDEAVTRLIQLEAIDLSQPDSIKPFYVELTDILRTYVGRRAHVPALESTTRELLERLSQSMHGTVVPGEVIAEINEVLSHADLVKFADLKPLLEQTRAMVTETRGAIEGTESAFRKLEEQRREEERARLEAQQYAPKERETEENP
jgi:hypothetical protein